MKSEDKTTYPGRIENQPYTMERTSAHTNPANEETENYEAANVIYEKEKEDYAVENNDEYAGR